MLSWVMAPRGFASQLIVSLPNLAGHPHDEIDAVEMEASRPTTPLVRGAAGAIPPIFLLDGTSFMILSRPAADKRRRSGRTR
jgi:hypothetical protein